MFSEKNKKSLLTILVYFFGFSGTLFANPSCPAFITGVASNNVFALVVFLIKLLVMAYFGGKIVQQLYAIVFEQQVNLPGILKLFFYIWFVFGGGWMKIGGLIEQASCHISQAIGISLNQSLQETAKDKSYQSGVKLPPQKNSDNFSEEVGKVRQNVAGVWQDNTSGGDDLVQKIFKTFELMFSSLGSSLAGLNFIDTIIYIGTLIRMIKTTRDLLQ